MANILAALKRHNIYRVAAAYAVVAWVLGQRVGILMPIFDLPQWIARAFLLLLGLGFPVALVFAWANQLALERGGAARVSTGKLDWFLAGALVVVIVLVSYQQLAPTRTAQSQQAGVTAARAASAAPAGAISIAVLPFVNLSGDATQEFFSDGMTEEITAALAKVPDLRVVGRTSAFQFKGEKKDLRAIGQALNATHLIEGSVRKDGNQLRITAQLIKAEDGTHVWTENYDRELKGVFAVQEEIASAIAGALRMPLGLKPGENLVNNRSIEPESYQQYLRAKALVRARGQKPLSDAAALLEQVVARDPNFAPAWAQLGLAYGLTPNYDPAWDSGSVDEFRRVVDASLTRAEAAARRAIQLDTNLADGYLSLARALDPRGKFLLAEEFYSKALALDPNNPDALDLYSTLVAGVGRLKEALAMKQRLLALEPLVLTYQSSTAGVLRDNGQTDAAMAMLKALPPGRASSLVAKLYAEAGRYGEAADALAIPSGTYLPGTAEETAARLLRTAPATAPSPQTLPPLGDLDWVYLYVGASGRVLDFDERNVDAGYLTTIDAASFWRPAYAPVRKTERFKALVRKAGLVDYWRAKGWPDLCHPVGADDFVCD
jgi:adenylate cyclase